MQILLRQNDAIPAGSGPLDNVLMTSTDLILIWAASGLQSISGGPKYQKTSFINYDEEEEKRCYRDGVGAVTRKLLNLARSRNSVFLVEFKLSAHFI